MVAKADAVRSSYPKARHGQEHRRLTTYSDRLKTAVREVKWRL